MTRETVLMAVYDDEAEAVIVEVDERQATIVLDDRGPIAFDLDELRAALGMNSQVQT